MTDLEPTPELVKWVRAADDGRLFRDSFNRFIIDVMYTDIDDTRQLDELHEAGLIDVAGYPRSAQVGPNGSDRWDSTDAGREWLAQAEREATR